MQSDMLTMRGVFYPTHYMVVMMPNREDAIALERELQDSGYDQHDIMLLESDVILDQIVGTAKDEGSPLPSAGTEGATVHQYAELARQGHCALMIHAPREEDVERVMQLVHGKPFSFAQKYRPLVIQDLD